MLDQMVFEYGNYLTFQRNLSCLTLSAQNGWSLLILNSERANERYFSVRLQRTRAAGFDFDGALIEGAHLRLLREVMEERARAADQKEADKYYTLIGQTEEWITVAVARIAEHLRGRLTRGHIAERLDRLPPRSGAVDLLRHYCNRSGVMVGSLGVKSYIAPWCAHYLSPSDRSVEVAALDLTWDEQGFCNGFDPASIVTDRNKGEWFHEFCLRRGIAQKDSLVLGDSPRTDASLLRAGGVRVLLWPVTGVSESAETDRLRTISDLWPDLDAVLIGDSLKPLVEILRAA